MIINEQNLRKRIGSPNMIGCYAISKEGQTGFTDVRGGEGDIVKIPTNDTDDLFIPYNDTHLTVGKFYSFLWKVDESLNRIVVTGVPSPIDNIRFLQGLFDSRLRLSGSLLEQFTNFQKTIFNEVTGAQHTFIYELLQNANDYPFEKEPVVVKFILTEHYLFFMHSGACFNLRNVVGISSVNQGEKKKNTETIGYKGIGFKTVFANNEYVYLKSGDWSLRFDKAYSEQEFAGDCPWALMPIPTTQAELDSEILNTLNSCNMRVQFALRHKTDASENIEQLDKVFSDDQVLLFIPNVYKVDVIQYGQLSHSVEKDATKWVVTDYRYPVPVDLKKWVEGNITAGDRIPEKFKDIDNVRISFAVGKNGKVINPVDNARVYNYLPTELRLGFRFLFNADFVPNGSRSGLHDVVWNDRIMEQCGCLFADWWVSFLQNEDEYDMASVFGLLPDYGSKDKYAIAFLNGFSNRIVSIPCIPTMRDGYHLVNLEEVLFDKIDFISCGNAILTDDEFYEFSDTTASLPHPSIRTNENLKALLRHFNRSIEFNNNQLTQLCHEDDFRQWLSKDINDISFIGYLIKTDYIRNFWEYKIFLREDGVLDKAGAIYYDIDRFIDDIKFLNKDLPRLSVSVRNSLTNKFDTWAGNIARFRKFRCYEFALNISRNFSQYSYLFDILENSVSFIHFLAVSDSGNPIAQNYPFFDINGNKILSKADIYIGNEIGYDLARRAWIKDEWIKFLHTDYLKLDEKKVSAYLETTCHIRALSQDGCYRNIISKDDRVPVIASLIKEKTNNIDFFRYLSKNQEYIGNLSQLMRQHFVVLATDGQKEEWAPVNKTIFWKDDDWTVIAGKAWMPAGCCPAISDIYFDNDEVYESEKLKSFFSQKQIVQKYSVGGLYQSLHSHLKEVFHLITDKESSKDFLNWIFLNRLQIFKDSIPAQFKSIPILCKDKTELAAIDSFGGNVYLPDREALELYNQPWFNTEILTICDDYYSDLFDGSERCDFYKSLGMKQFDKLHYLRAHLLKHLDILKENLNSRDNNLLFHRYLADVHDSIAEKDLETVKAIPIFISAPDNAEGILDDRSDNHYLPSELLSTVISKDLVPLSILDSIHPDYIKSEKDKKYFIDKLGNSEIDEDGFYNYIIQESNTSIVKQYLEDRERNIRFWRWVADSKVKVEKKSKLAVFPLLGKETGDEYDHFEVPSSLCISGKYSKLDGLEQFINEHISKPIFVSDAYLEEGKDRDWQTLFRALKVTVDFGEIVFKNIFPRLDKYKNVSIVIILAQYKDRIAARLKSNEDYACNCLKHLQLLCQDGCYRPATEVLVSGRYSEVNQNPFPDIAIANILSEDYIASCGEDQSKRREITDFIKIIADNFCNKCENATQLRNHKLSYFASHQDEFKDSEAHYRIIGQLADSYASDPEGIREILKEHGDIKAYTTSGKFIPLKGQYLSTAYNPECQFMEYGITELDFVSEKYADYSPAIKSLLMSQSVRFWFSSGNLNLLRNECFAIYFWEVYAPNRESTLKEFITEENLKKTTCIPTPAGMKRPCDVYDYRYNQLRKIVLKLDDGNNKLPSVMLPKWIERIGFRNKLYLNDCLDYMRKDIIDFRRDVLEWLLDTPETELSIHRQLISDYAQNANWLNGAKKWVPLRTLVALEWGNKTLKDNFSGSAYVCNPSFMPESQRHYELLCKILDIKILTNADFTKKKEGNCKPDTEALSILLKRLLYLAYKTGKDNWKEIYEGYKEKLQKADISTCERIVYSYNDDISKELRIYAEEPENLWYIGRWNGPMFLAVLDWIKDKIGISGNYDTNYLSDLFLNSFDDFIQREEGGTLPEELLDCLSQNERSGIGVDTLANAEKYNDNQMENDGAPTQVPVNYRTSGLNKASTNRPVETSRAESGNNIEAGSTNKPVQTAEHSPVKTTPDRAAAARNNSTQISNSNGNTTQVSDNITKGTESSKRTPLLERLNQKWQQQQNSPVAKPHSVNAKKTPVDIFKGDSSQPIKSEGDFFDNNVKADRQQPVPSLSNDKSIDNYSRKYEAAQDDADKIKDQKDLAELFSRTPKYTFLWFKYLTEMMYADKNNTATTRSVQIDFKNAKATDKCTLALINPNRVIPNWIEQADTIELFTLKGNIPTKNEVQLQCFTEDAIWLYSEDAGNLETELRNSEKIRLVASGTATDHIDSLTKQFVKLGYKDDFNLKDSLPGSIKYIYGPPGTGKTTRLVEIIDDIISAGNVNMDILVLTPTNKAADVIAMKLKHNVKCEDVTYRYGITESLSYLEIAPIFTRDDDFINRDNYHIVVTTAARYSYDYFSPDEEIICDHDWDYIIIDEASMIDIVTIAFILHKGRSSQFIISGDPKQIQPVQQNDIQPENIYQMVGLDSFAAALNQHNVEALKVQYRSVPSIGKLVSDYSYDGIVEPHRDKTSCKPLDIGIKISNINFIGFHTEPLDNLYGPDAIDASAFHLYSAIFAYEFAGYIAKRIKQAATGLQYTLGIVCPYKKQADAIRQMSELRDVSNDKCHISCGTVHSFQGDECDIMIVVLNPPINIGQNSHVNNQNIINVAISRAKDYVFFLVPDNQTPGFYTRETLGKYAIQKTILFCPDIEERMFGDREFIKSHTNVSCHTPVNIYYESTSLYEVRKDDNAVDIQINEQFRPDNI